MLRARPRAGLGWCLLLLVLVSLLADPARAAVRVIASDWRESADAAPDAQRRASEWTDVLGLRMVQVLSTDPDDRFAETIVVFEHTEPIPAQMFAEPEQAIASLREMVVKLVGTNPPIASELQTLASGERIVWAQWIVDELTYECVLAPSGQSTSLIVVAVLTSQLSARRAELDRIYTELEGVTAPMPAFSLPAWRWGSLAIWVALALGLHALMLMFVDRDGDHRQAGLRAVMITAPVVLIGTLVVRSLLLERELALTHAGTSVTGLVTWIGVVGLCVVGLHVLLAQRADRGVVLSAPATGAFASGTYSTSDMVRATIQRAALRDPSASGARPRRLDPGDSDVYGTEMPTGDSQPIILDDPERLPPGS